MIRSRLLPHNAQRHGRTTTETIPNDADAAAGLSSSVAKNSHNAHLQNLHHHHIQPSPISADSSMASSNFASAPTSGNLEFFEDLVSEPVLVLGVDISHLSRKGQFVVCATGVFVFSLLYGFLQELISVTIFNRKLGLFLAAMQFTGYVFWAFLLQRYVYQGRASSKSKTRKTTLLSSLSPSDKNNSNSIHDASSTSSTTDVMMKDTSPSKAKIPSSLCTKDVPMMMYLGLSLLRAIDLGMTNLAMQYINYPAKTLMKSSRVVFTMLFGVLILRKRYRVQDYVVVLLMVSGLAIFMHADANSSAVFHHLGIIMLTISLLCDGAITNMSESIMNKFGVGQDEFILNMYSIALVAISIAAIVQGDMKDGLYFLFYETGKYGEMNLPLDERTLIWSPMYKVGVVVLFSTMGFFGSSCSAAITKNFGAMTMSLTSTVRKATTLFISFAIFDNECTMEHISGICFFMSALMMKTLWKNGKKGSSSTSYSPSSTSRKGRRKKLRSSINLESLSSSSSNIKLDVASGSADPSSLSNNNDEIKNLLEMPSFRDSANAYVA